MSTADYAAASASHLTKGSIHRLAESVAKQLGYEPGDDLTALVKKLGGEVQYKDFWGGDQSDSGSTVISGEGSFIIYIARQTSYERDRFTIAHELGHYVLHYLWAKRKGKDVQAMRANRYGSDRTEWEANWFAAAFLMPEQPFQDYFSEVDGDITLIADKFGVSSTAARIRAQALGLLAP